MMKKLLAALALAGTAVLAAQAGQRSVALVVTGGTVVTMDGTGRVLSPGAVAIDGREIVAVDAPEVVAARFTGPGHDRRSRPGRDARPDQHAHPRADGPVSAGWPTIWR